MKIVTIELPDEDADALEKAAQEGGFASSADFIRAAIGNLITAPAYDPDALARDVAAHKAAKRQGDAGVTPAEARAWLKASRSA